MTAPEPPSGQTRERPILMSAPMVRAILSGAKTQTRRALRGFYPKNAPEYDSETGRLEWFNGDEVVVGMRCPYGRPGEKLWVREAWAPDPPIDSTWASTEWSGCGRRIDGVPERFQHPAFCVYREGWLHGDIRWRPGIHMPRWASRITLEVTGVRVERLQSISDADAIAEGIERGDGFPGWYRGPLPGDSSGLAEAGRNFKVPTAFPALAYRALWESINGPGSWERNDWLWIVEFRPTPARGAGLMREGE